MRYFLLGVLVLAMLAGCGGSSDSQEGESRPAGVARAEYVRRVDAVCKETTPKLAKIMSAITRTRDAARAGRVSLPETFQTFATLLRRASTTTERFRARLEAIAVPPREQAFHDSLTASLEEGSSNLRRQVSAAEAQDPLRLRELSVNGSLINARGKGLIAGHGGFRFCGRQ